MKEVIIYTTKICPYCVRAKELLKYYTITSTEPQKNLEREMGLPPYSDMPVKLVIIAGRELAEEGYQYRKPGEVILPL